MIKNMYTLLELLRLANKEDCKYVLFDIYEKRNKKGIVEDVYYYRPHFIKCKPEKIHNNSVEHYGNRWDSYMLITGWLKELGANNA
jgi:hypothetical protein